MSEKMRIPFTNANVQKIYNEHWATIESNAMQIIYRCATLYAIKGQTPKIIVIVRGARAKDELLRDYILKEKLTSAFQLGDILLDVNVVVYNKELETDECFGMRVPKVGDTVYSRRNGGVYYINGVSVDVWGFNVFIHNEWYDFSDFNELFDYHDTPSSKMAIKYQETKKIQSETHTINGVDYLVSLYAVGGEDYPKVGDTVYSKERGYSEHDITAIDLEDSTICLDVDDWYSLDTFHRDYATKPTEEPKPTAKDKL